MNLLDILHEEQWQTLSACGLDKEGGFLGALGVDDAAEPGRSPGLPLMIPRPLARTATGRPSMCAWPQSISRGDAGLELIQRSAIEDAGQHRGHVVGHAVVVGQEIVQVGWAGEPAPSTSASGAGHLHAGAAGRHTPGSLPGTLVSASRPDGATALTSVCMRAPPSDSASTV